MAKYTRSVVRLDGLTTSPLIDLDLHVPPQLYHIDAGFCYFNFTCGQRLFYPKEIIQTFMLPSNKSYKRNIHVLAGAPRRACCRKGILKNEQRTAH